MKKTEDVKDKVVGIKLNANEDRMLRAYAGLNTGGKITPAIRDAISFFFVRVEIENHVADSLDRNMREFGGDFARFCDYLKSADKFSPLGKPEHRDERGNRTTQYDIKTFISAETFNLLRQWSEREPAHRERFMQEVVFRSEFWLHPDSIQPFLFPDDFPENAAPPKKKRRKSEAAV